MRNRKVLLAVAAVMCIAVAAVVIVTQNPGAEKMISEISEHEIESLTGESAPLDLYQQGVPLIDSIAASDTNATEVVELVNAERAKVGVGPLVGNIELNAAANVRAKEVAASFSHYRPDGSLCFTVLNEFGIKSSARAENIAGNFKSPQLVVQGWMKSEGHKKNILNGDYNKIGVGIYIDSTGKLSWVQLFTD